MFGPCVTVWVNQHIGSQIFFCTCRETLDHQLVNPPFHMEVGEFKKCQVTWVCHVQLPLELMRVCCIRLLPGSGALKDQQVGGIDTDDRELDRGNPLRYTCTFPLVSRSKHIIQLLKVAGDMKCWLLKRNTTIHEESHLNNEKCTVH